MNCSACGQSNPLGSAFCDSCGAALTMSGSAAPVAQSAATAQGNACPHCGQSFISGQAFCDSCGFSLGAPTSSSPLPAQPTVPVAAVRDARLIVQDSGAEVVVPANRMQAIVGRADAASNFFPDVDLDPFDALKHGVGRRHAQLAVQDGQVVLEDLNSVNGTAVNRQRLLPRQPLPLQDGDEVRFGTLITTFRRS